MTLTQIAKYFFILSTIWSSGTAKLRLQWKYLSKVQIMLTIFPLFSVVVLGDLDGLSLVFIAEEEEVADKQKHYTAHDHRYHLKIEVDLCGNANKSNAMNSRLLR
jgi:hypothetical protein